MKTLFKTSFFIFLAFNLCFLYFVSSLNAQSSQVGVSISASIAETSVEPEPPPELDQGGSIVGGALVSQPFASSVILKGKTSPGAFVTVKVNNDVIGNALAEPSGLFEKRIDGLFGDEYNFSLYGRDTFGRISSIFNFSVPAFADKITTATGIFLSPTISTVPQTLTKGQSLYIFGEALPASTIYTFIFSPDYKIAFFNSSSGANHLGHWMQTFNTSPLSAGWYQVKAFAVSPEGEHSPFSLGSFFFVKDDNIPSSISPKPPVLIPETEVPTETSTDTPVIADPADIDDLDKGEDKHIEEKIERLFIALKFMLWTLLVLIIFTFIVFLIKKRKKKRGSKP